MCSIPGLPVPGSEVHVLITRINLNKTFGLVELWINLDDEKKHIYDQMKEDIQIPKRKFNGSEGQPGDLCLVLFRDTWNRARIVSIQAGFDESKGSWDEEAYEDFYNLLVDKPLKVTVIDVEDHSELGVPQYAVQVECEGVIINSLMRKYWKESSEVPLKECTRLEKDQRQDQSKQMNALH
ncbi:uncharacterized protein LOC103379303 isoform X2 [Cynoglossus semilaevis]|uniref:uncharacterized protein LOC103379303 isoform X2 n=1 Tax=Cynoglossus semilaevis TaxID=244447 RepID=UPI000D62C5CF|nr:uncharacterized protein LOC103379303 isoform X2 [Cynoglossus semilaevis]